MAEKKEENVQIGMRVKQARETAGLTQERLAELLDVTAQYISGVERGAVGLSVPILLQLCSVLLVSSDFILLGDIDISDVSGVANRLSRMPADHIKNVENIINRYIEGIAIEKSRRYCGGSRHLSLNHCLGAPGKESRN